MCLLGPCLLDGDICHPNCLDLGVRSPEPYHLEAVRPWTSSFPLLHCSFPGTGKGGEGVKPIRWRYQEQEVQRVKCLVGDGGRGNTPSSAPAESEYSDQCCCLRTLSMPADEGAAQRPPAKESLACAQERGGGSCQAGAKQLCRVWSVLESGCVVSPSIMQAPCRTPRESRNTRWGERGKHIFSHTQQLLAGGPGSTILVLHP
jgi:hypothetical protein